MKLRFVTAYTIFAMMILSEANGQNKNDTATITHIKSVYQQVNNYKNYHIVTIDDTGNFLGDATDNGGYLKGYFLNDSLKKIVEWVGLSNKVIQIEYYFDKRQLLFVYQKENMYHFNDSTQSFDYIKHEISFSGRYYFNNSTLIYSIISDKEHQETKQKDATDLLTSAKDYEKLLEAKRK